jgi:glycosyltransferase involved in cell wall biosynthesis
LGGLFVDQLTPMVIAFNEAPNLRRCFERLRWARRILLVDSGSTDATLEIAGDFPQTQVVQRPFDDFAGQCNFGLSLISTPWVLSLDADYELSEELVREVAQLEVGNFAAFEAAFIYRIYGRPLRAALYPPRRVLYLRDKAVYRNEGHGHRVVIDGAVGKLRGRIYHDDRKPLARWLASQQNYARHEADYLLATEERSQRMADRVRARGWPAPLAIFLYTLLWQGCVADGWAGWFYVLQRTLAEIMIALEIVDRRLSAAGKNGCSERVD